MGFREYMPTQLPPWLQGEVGKAWASALGGVKDGMTQLLKERVAARFPVRPNAASLAPIAPTDALEAMGREQQMPRAVGESDAAYAERLSQAFEIWEHAGTAYGVLLALRGAGYTTARIAIVRGRLYHLDDAGALVVERLPVGSWSFEAEPQPFWSKFALLFDHEAGLPADWYTGTIATSLDEREDFNTDSGTSSIGPSLTISGPAVGLGVAIRVRVTTAGYQDGVLYTYSLDDGATWAPEDTSDATPRALTTDGTIIGPLCGVTLAFPLVEDPLGEYVSGEEYRWPVITTPDFVVPATDSISVRGARQLAIKWKSAISTFAGVIIISKGRSLGTLPPTLGEWASTGGLGEHEVTFYGPTPA